MISDSPLSQQCPEDPRSERLLTAPKAWHCESMEQALAALESTPAGLTSAEARRRLSVHGFNEVEPERQPAWWEVLLHQFRDPLIYLLLAAAAVTLALRDYSDSAIILAVVVLNAVIGFVQERRAGKESRALAQLSAPRADVIRDGERRSIAGRELVPGDIVVLASGSRVPADVRLIATNDLMVDESLLTGESMPTAKHVAGQPVVHASAADQHNMAFSATLVTRGRGRGLVVRTGARTELGRIADSMRRLETGVTPLQEEVARFARRIGIVIMVLAAAIAAIGLLRGLPAAEIFLTAVAAAVSAIPEGLPVVLTITLAIGVRRMAGRNAIVRSLPAVETLGRTTVIASDKTGTLTQNRLAVRAVWVGGQTHALTAAATPAPLGNACASSASAPAAARRALLIGALANEARSAVHETTDAFTDPLERALLDAARSAGITVGVLASYRERALLPFESERRMMASLVAAPEGMLLVAKGAPEALLERCTEELGRDGAPVPLDARAALAAAAELASAGMRVIATAYREVPGTAEAARIDDAALSGMTLSGLLGLEDPVRPESAAAVAAAGRAGIRVLMLTCDHAATARAIGTQLELGGGDETRVVEGAEIEGLTDAELDRLLAEVPAFARVGPQHKLRIVQRLRAAGEVVAVTGDGVNDAPALRAAHLGVAMGRGGTDVAREAADIVLADDNFATITAAVEEGRIAFANVRKVTFFLLSTGVGEVLTVIASLLAGWPLPFTAAQILWINLVTNGLQDVALAFEPGEPGLLSRPPRHAREGLLTDRLLERLLGVGLVLAAGTLAVFWLTLEATGDLAAARTMAMTQMVVFQFFHVFNCRSLDRSVFRLAPLSNPFLFLSLVGAAAAHLGVLYLAPLQAVFRTTPLSGSQWLLLLAVGSTVVLGGEADKWRNRRRVRPLG